MLLSSNAFERAHQLKNPCLDRTLVIVDMQDDFIRRNHEQKLVPIICRLITHAKQQKWAVILVEYYGFGNTNKDIREAVKNYPHIKTVIKKEWDGGKEVVDCINRHPSWSLNLLICGIYGNQCVSYTVAGLFDASDLVEVDIITDAVSPSYCSSSEKDEHGQQQEREIMIGDLV